jgi:hypothetical protein
VLRLDSRYIRKALYSSSWRTGRAEVTVLFHYMQAKHVFKNYLKLILKRGDKRVWSVLNAAISARRECVWCAFYWLHYSLISSFVLCIKACMRISWFLFYYVTWGGCCFDDKVEIFYRVCARLSVWSLRHSCAKGDALMRFIT